MSKYQTKYWSKSKKANIPIEELNPSHLLNIWNNHKAAVQQMEDDSVSMGEPASAYGREGILAHEVFQAIVAEVKERGLDKPKSEATS